MGNQCDFKFLQKRTELQLELFFFFFFQKVLQFYAVKNKYLALKGYRLPRNDVQYVLKFPFYCLGNWPDGRAEPKGPTKWMR